MKLNVFFYTYEYSIDRDTGNVAIPDVYITHRTPDYDYGEVMLGEGTIEYTPPVREVVVAEVVAMLEQKGAKVQREAEEKLEAIKEKIATYAALTWEGGMVTDED